MIKNKYIQNTLVYSLITFVTLSCSSVDQEKIVVESEQSSCVDEFQAKRSQYGHLNSIADDMIALPGTIASYSLVAAIGTAEFLGKSSLIVGGALLVCAPAILISTSSDSYYYSDSNLDVRCLGEVGDSIHSILEPLDGTPGVVTRETASWRCANQDQLSEDLRGLATCYYKQGKKELARRQVENMVGDRILRDCVSVGEMGKVVGLLSKIQLSNN